MKVQQILEGISEILYHYTRLNGLTEILKTGEFRLTPDLGTDVEKVNRQKDKIYYGSFSRSRVGRYHYPIVDVQQGATIIVVDGRKLQADGYTGAPMDYWGWGGNQNDEMEDRVYSKQSTIPNFLKYIREVHILVSDQDTTARDNAVRAARLAYRTLTQRGISVYVYSSAKHLNMLNKAKAVSVKSLKTERPPEFSTGWLEGTNWFAPYIELLKVDDRNRLSDKARKTLRMLRGLDGKTILKNDIHNSRTGRSRPQLDKFLNHLKANNITSVEQYVDHIVTKFTD